MEKLGELFETFGSRIKSRIFGSILFALIFANWKLIFFLFFADVSVEVRINYVESNFSIFWSFLLPLAIGVAIALISPWVSYWGAVLAETPSTRRRLLQLKADQDVLEQKRRLDAKLAELSLEEEQRLVERAKRDQAIEAEIEDPEQLAALRKEIDGLRENLSSVELGSSAIHRGFSAKDKVEQLQSLADKFDKMGDYKKAADLLEQAAALMNES